MNRHYKTVWSHARQQWVVTSELAKSHSKSSRSSVVKAAIATSLLALASGTAFAECTGGYSHDNLYR
ncbi:ESPR domain-containing protein [Basilea psittacipulmonis]|uniref:ESPR domain-containing protein n=1 Tax=Basilea psittacipulmonis TaxID=1472345 RepID=UPI000986CB55